MGDMTAMSSATSTLLGGDAGDAIYALHLINGHPLADPLVLSPQPRPGERIRLRIINAGGDTAYRVAVGGHRLTVTHTDGFPVVPVQVDTLLVGMGERYDATIDVRSGAWPIVAKAEGKSARAAALLRTADTTTTTTAAPELSQPVAELTGRLLTYGALAATDQVMLRPPVEMQVATVTLTGGMSKFDWGINGLPYDPTRTIEVDPNGWLALNITNATTMWHPVHLHGHTWQMTGVHGTARKDTVNVLPGETVNVAVATNNPGAWMLHCHNAFHLEAGMATVVSYRQ